MSQQVIIFDTTLRDGEQALQASLSVKEKLQIALALERMGVDVMEVGFPVSSPGDFESVQTIARQVKNSRVCALARCVEKDIDVAAESLKVAEAFRIHTFIATSPMHIATKLRSTLDEVIERAIYMVKRARNYTDDVEFSCEDAGRTPIADLARVVEAAINAGATTINIPDTVGYTMPFEFAGIISGLYERSPTLYVDSWNPHHAPFFSAVGSSIAMTLWAFLGLESACANTDVVENPERNVPIAVLGGTLGAAVIYIVSTNVIAGIVPNMELANSTAPFGLAFAQMFTPEVGKVIMALMVMSCCGSLLGWQFTIAQVFKSSSDEGYFPKIFSRVTKVDAPVQGMLTIVIIQSGLALMTISPSLNSQFNVLVNLAVVTNIIPYILSMAALVIIQKVANVPPSKAKVANFVAFVGAMYSFYALYSSGEEAMLYGSIVTFLGWTLYGLVSPRFELKNKHG